MANKKTTTEEVFYIVMTEEYPLESGDNVSVQDGLEKAYIDAVEAWSHEGGDKYIAYEVRKLGYVKITTEK